ncbi:lipase [Solimonas sp. K1W22B-7]|uniref:esterase/lipase family protein n=1 Tax=Solimonas sp. K1W22B-7 TaxID=2303331 RepID=UPI000E333011|nr:lipase [Solimonas sp. K1W22B-7]AXQ30103.1 lipase [Solimonas sp. K1W22B-7]
MNKTLLPLLAALCLAACGGNPSGAAPEDTLKEGTAPAAMDLGPALQVPLPELEKALTCTPDMLTATRDVVLITPAFTNDVDSFGWNYLRQLPALGIPTCSLAIPGHGFDDLQIAAEYVVHAVRKINAQSGRKLVLFGHQHGPLDEMWALKFWPDLASKVSSYISLATPHNGTVAAKYACMSFRRCPPSVWQIAAGSKFLAALKARPLPPGLAYTSISTNFDEVILPQPAASALQGGTQIVLQQLCAGRPIEHFTILADRVTYELVLDAINHPGQPADPARLEPGFCSGPLYMPGVINPASAIAALKGFGTFSFDFLIAVPVRGLAQEPPLREYALGP